jgi:hypothetical protein
MLATCLVACTSFEAGDNPAPTPAPSTTSTASGDGGSPPPGDAAAPSDGGTIAPRRLECGMNSCDPGHTCCVQSGSATCDDDVCNGGWRFKCFGKADCPIDTVCCNRDKVVSCEPSCDGAGAQQICEHGDECPSNNCQTDACGSNEIYGTCAPQAAQATIKPLCF